MELVNQRCGGTEERSVEGNVSDGENGAGADRKNHESVFRVAAILRCVIPTIEHFHDGADQADEQDNRGGDSEDGRVYHDAA